MAVLTPAQIAALVKKHGNPPPLATVIAVSIALAESGGNTTIDHTVKGGSAPGSVDRGLWQINSHFHPEVSDVAAHDPDMSTAAAQTISKNWTDFSPWTTFKSGSNQSHIDAAALAVANNNPTSAAVLAGEAHHKFDLGHAVTGAAGNAVGAAGSAIAKATGLDAIGNFFKAIMNVDLWKRIGIGALAVGLLIVGLMLFSDFDVKDIPAPVPV